MSAANSGTQCFEEDKYITLEHIFNTKREENNSVQMKVTMSI